MVLQVQELSILIPLPALWPETAVRLCTWPVPAQDTGQQALRGLPTAVSTET